MGKQSISWMLLLLLAAISACVPQQPAGIVQLDSGTLPTLTPRIIYVTPTLASTAIPTIQVASATPVLSPTPAPTQTPDQAEYQAQCSAQLIAIYTTASDQCLGEANGAFCNGGLPPRAEPAGGVSSALGVLGALVAINNVDLVQTAPLLTNGGGGVMWIRADDPLNYTGLLVGDVEIRDVTPPESTFSPWQSFSVRTNSTLGDCRSAALSTLMLQGPYGMLSRVVINGVSVELNGTIAIQTYALETAFIVLEGSARLTVFGQSLVAQSGQQIDVPYADDTLLRPTGIPAQAEPLTYASIRNLPIMLLDRPVLLPQPGFAYTDSNVNMRAEPDEDARLLFTVPADETVSIMGTNPERTWLHVRLGNGETGWMRADLLRGEFGNIEVVYAVTPQPPERFGDAAHLAMVVAPSGGNLRQAPDVQFPIVDTLDQGKVVELLARSPYSPWVKVDAGGQVGWMALITVETDTVIGFLPIDYDVPLPPGPTATPIFAFGGGHAYPDPLAGQ
jgi:uncharacterized protein YgiM (DUF1202 family)